MQNKELFERLYREHYPGLLHFAKVWLGASADAHEVVQEVFVAVWEKGDQLNWDSGLKSYLFRSVKNKCFNLNRDRKPTSDIEDQKDQLKSKESSPEQTLIDADLNKEINRAIASLPDRCRQVFLLKRREGFSQKQIAELMEISEKTVEGQLSKAMKILRSKIKMDHG